MTLFITSSPYVENADRPILNGANGFLDRLRTVLPPHPRCLFICSDPDNRENTCRWGGDTAYAFSQAGLPFQSYQILDGYNRDEAGYWIENSDLIVLAGGHVPTQNRFFRETGLRELLQGFDGVVIGISAGSMNMADSAYIQPEEPGESSPGFVRFRPGLGLTQANIVPHYQKVKDNILDGKRLYEDVTFADSMGHSFFVLPDGSYIFEDPDSRHLCGKAWRIKNGIMELLTLDGETLDLNILK